MTNENYEVFANQFDELSDEEKTEFVKCIALHYRVPSVSAGSFARWYVRGVKPGDFLSNMLRGKVYYALHIADSDNTAAITNWAELFSNFLPIGLWGEDHCFERCNELSDEERKDIVKQSVFDWLIGRRMSMEQFCASWFRHGRAIVKDVSYCSWCDIQIPTIDLVQGICPKCYQQEQDIINNNAVDTE